MPDSAVNHYRIARECQGHHGDQWRMVKLTGFAKIEDFEFAARLFEQTLVCLFNSYNKDVLAAVSIEDVAAKSNYFLHATTWKSLSARAFDQCGWSTDNAIVGCNWASPIGERMHEGPLIVRTFLPDGPFDPHRTERILFRKRVNVHCMSTGCPGFGLGISTKQAFAIRLTTSDIPPGTEAFAVCEVMVKPNDVNPEDLKKWGLSSTDHPLPYARLPRVGPFSDYSDMNRLGIYSVETRRSCF
jgi:hypothetical protein